MTTALKSVYIDENGMFEVFQAEGRYYLSILVGGIAMYEVQREMSEEMVALYLNDPMRLTWWVDKIRHEER